MISFIQNTCVPISNLAPYFVTLSQLFTFLINLTTRPLHQEAHSGLHAWGSHSFQGTAGWSVWPPAVLGMT